MNTTEMTPTDIALLRKKVKLYTATSYVLQFLRLITFIVWLYIIWQIFTFLFPEGVNLTSGIDLLVGTPFFVFPSIPIIWFILTLSHNIQEYTYLAQDYFSRAYIEEHIYEWTKKDPAQRQTLLTRYFDSWLLQSPAVNILRIKQKNQQSRLMSIDEVIENTLKKNKDAKNNTATNNTATQ